MIQRRSAALLLLAILVWAFSVSPSLAQTAAVTDAEVEAAITRMQNWILERQNKETGAWPNEDMPTNEPFDEMVDHEKARSNGATVMAIYSLIMSGRNPQEPAIARGLRFLRENDPWGTYGISVRTHIWAALPDAYRSNLEQDARWLERAQSGGLWGYGPVRGQRVDHSTTQYGVLGLWEASKRNVRMPDKVWEDVVAAVLAEQTPDGAWCYGRKDYAQGPTGSMTTAGLTMLYVAIQQLYRDREVPSQIQESLAKGHAWLDKNFSADRNPAPQYEGGDRGEIPYYLYGLERVALASGVKTFGGQDWYEAGAASILRMENKRGSVGGGAGGAVANTGFALMFLARGRVPVWINKIALPGVDWNNRPNDIYFLNRYLSDLREQELNWQVVGIDYDSANWMGAPIAWISSDDKVTLTDPQKANLKKYLDLGGVLIVNPEGGEFTGSMRGLAKELYPDFPLKNIESDHPALTMLYPASGGRNIQVVNNGVRDLIVVLGQDWGKELQAGKRVGEDDAWIVMTNLYAAITDRGTLSNRLVPRFEKRVAGKTSKGKIAVARVQHGGKDWDVELDSWMPFETSLFNLTGWELERKTAKIEELTGSGAALAHLAGVAAYELTPAEVQALQSYVQGGGTVFVETIGGRGDFSVKLEQQLRAAFKAEAAPLQSYDPIVSGQTLDGGQKAGRVLFRPFSVINMAAKREPRVTAIDVNGRHAVIFSHDDLSLGVLGLRRWGINGYQPDSAKLLLTNIVLSGKKNSSQ